MVKQLTEKQKLLLRAMFAGNDELTQQIGKELGPNKSMQVVNIADEILGHDLDLKHLLTIPESISEV